MSAGSGSESKKYTVHESFAIKSSKYIQSALGNNDWKEGQEKHIGLIDHEPESLEGYINWLYTREVTLTNAEEKCKYHGPSQSQIYQASDCSRNHCLKLIKMYVLGDYLNDMRFCNAVIDTIGLMRGGCVPSLDAI